MTATWKVYSDIRLVVLLEKRAVIDTASGGWGGRDALNSTLTDVLVIVISFDEGRWLSSGNAEAKSQSSSGAFVLCVCAGVEVAFVDCEVVEKSNRDVEDAGACCWYCDGGAEENAAKGSDCEGGDFTC